MKTARPTAEQIAWLKYRLQACRNLEADFLNKNDLNSAAHFQFRQKQINKELDKVKP